MQYYWPNHRRLLSSASIFIFIFIFTFIFVIGQFSDFTVIISVCKNWVYLSFILIVVIDYCFPILGGWVIINLDFSWFVCVGDCICWDLIVFWNCGWEAKEIAVTLINHLVIYHSWNVSSPNVYLTHSVTSFCPFYSSLKQP